MTHTQHLYLCAYFVICYCVEIHSPSSDFNKKLKSSLTENRQIHSINFTKELFDCTDCTLYSLPVARVVNNSPPTSAPEYRPTPPPPPPRQHQSIPQTVNSTNVCFPQSVETLTRTETPQDRNPLGQPPQNKLLKHMVRSVGIFTTLHGMQTRSSDENSVCLSVYPSVRPSVTRVNCDKTVERSVQIYIPYERTFSLVF